MRRACARRRGRLEVRLTACHPTTFAPLALCALSCARVHHQVRSQPATEPLEPGAAAMAQIAISLAFITSSARPRSRLTLAPVHAAQQLLPPPQTPPSPPSPSPSSPSPLSRGARSPLPSLDLAQASFELPTSSRPAHPRRTTLSDSLARALSPLSTRARRKRPPAGQSRELSPAPTLHEPRRPTCALRVKGHRQGPHLPAQRGQGGGRRRRRNGRRRRRRRRRRAEQEPVHVDGLAEQQRRRRAERPPDHLGRAQPPQPPRPHGPPPRRRRGRPVGARLGRAPPQHARPPGQRDRRRERVECAAPGALRRRASLFLCSVK